MSQVTVTARIDAEDKTSFDKFCDAVGLNTSTAINLFIKTVIREKRIPFDIVQPEDPFYKKENLEYVKKSVEELRAGKGQKHDLIEVD